MAHLIAARLQVHGYRVGLYTSPHLLDFRERIRVNGTPISEEYVVNFVETEKDFFEPLNPSFFELATAMAFKYFKEMEVDIAVVEVGLGGRLDCTNIIKPILSIITNISLDHTQLLGGTAALIGCPSSSARLQRRPALCSKPRRRRPMPPSSLLKTSRRLCQAYIRGEAFITRQSTTRSLTAS